MGRPPGSTNVDWEGVVVQLREHPGRWRLLAEMASVTDRTINIIRRRENAHLRLPDGVIRVRRKATVWLPDGTVRCTLALKFEKREMKHGTQAAEADGH